MGFASVYKTLIEIFPQIDSRILRAVAIEHSKDADVAVEVVLAEVIPSLGSSSGAERSSYGGETIQHVATVDPIDTASLSRLSTKVGSSETDGRLHDCIEVADTVLCGQTNHSTVVEPVASGSSGTSVFHDAIVETNIVSDSLVLSMEKYQDNSNIDSDNATLVSLSEGGSFYNTDQRCGEIGGYNAASLGELVVTDVGLFEEEVACQLDVITPVAKDKHHNLYADDEIVIGSTSSQLVGICETHLAVTQESDFNSLSKVTSERDDSLYEPINSEDESISIITSTLTRSVCSTEFLDDIIEDARNSKKVFVSTMDSVVSMMKDVEFKEAAAEQAKVEAARGCFDILEKVDELKETLRRAKEANDMHAGEVNAEKAILATELKELQLRLFTLSEERDLSLQILDEMRRALEIRLATALEKMKAAEVEKMEKEASAREALAYQESQMENIVQESKKLKLEAEENSKLQDFLMDRGRAIDMIQGEISVKCQDVRLLKEKFDKGMPLFRSLSCTQTSSILASSVSSFRSTVTPPEPEAETYETPKAGAEAVDAFESLEKISRSGLRLSPSSPKEHIYYNDSRDCFLSGEGKHGDDSGLRVDDDWELFDKEDACLNA